MNSDNTCLHIYFSNTSYHCDINPDIKIIISNSKLKSQSAEQILLEQRRSIDVKRKKSSRGPGLDLSRSRKVLVETMHCRYYQYQSLRDCCHSLCYHMKQVHNHNNWSCLEYYNPSSHTSDNEISSNSSRQPLGQDNVGDNSK